MKLAYAAILSLSLPMLASAGLTIQVDTNSKTYFLSGSASGTPKEDEDFGDGSIFWDNRQPVNGGYVSFLSAAAFSVTGNTSSGFTMFLHGNGDVNGVLNLNTASTLTLSGNQSVKYNYSTWSPALQAMLEGKAAANEFLPVTNGASASFGMNFAVIPEPSSLTLLLTGVGGLGLFRRRPRHA